MTDPKTSLADIRLMLLLDCGLPTQRALAYLHDMEANPQKLPRYKALLSDHLDTTLSSMEGLSEDERTRCAVERIQVWKANVDSVTIQDVVAMCKQWNVSIEKIVDQKMTPELIRSMLDVYIIGHDEYKIQLSLAFYTYLMKRTRQVGLPKSNLLVCGPSGSGKTYGMQVLCELFRVPFALIHCNSVVQEGIVGSSLTDAFTSLLEKWDEAMIRNAVVCFDEFDKLFESGSYNARIVNEMLNIIDDKGEIEFKKSFRSDSDRVTLPTGKMMFVFTGVFDGIHEKEEEKVAPIGFHTVVQEKIERRKELTAEDFIRFGIKPEIMGRIQNFVVIEALTEEELYDILNMGLASPFTEFERYFALNDIQAILTEEGKRALAHLAKERGLGVRGLKSLLHKALLEDMYDLEVGANRILNITREYVYDNLK